MRNAGRIAITLCLAGLAILAGYWLWQHYMLSPWTRDARVRADVVTIAPDVSGWVVDLKVRDNQRVEAGQVLFHIDRERYQAAVDKARAVAETRRQQMRLREHEASRRSHLGPQAISAELKENAQINADIARGEYREAMADVSVAELNLSRSEVRAPRAGQVTNLRLAQGNYVQAGQPVMALVDDASFYIQAYFEETKLPRIRLGAPVKVWLMGAGQALDGTVESISRGITDRNASPDAQLLANVEPTFNWVRLAQRIPVRIQLNRVPGDVLLSAGMTASVQVVSDNASAGE
ncbi:efflux transporter periplasmic adaptor subunit [Pseudomonas sp. PIC25]|uniref:efflux RND transporter periplasmic adaptor subunit n=1 Tax=Pseudomonas sp. PIC25 TaxID=1958773 RepID=UPI000BAC0D65|nr:efflux RND transporter periplasmic adaptor subunit [Pseudomonas sp. PIC25]PAU54970.1 efflux transporter periplasmic adaptor subunit [Pseudomonas sp. PIC25]